MKLPEGAKLYDFGLANNFLYLTLNAQATKVHQRKSIPEWKDNPWNETKHLQVIYLIRN